MKPTKEELGWDGFHKRALKVLDPVLAYYGWTLVAQVEEHLDRVSRSYSNKDAHLRIQCDDYLEISGPFKVFMWIGESGEPDQPLTLVEYVSDKRAGDVLKVLQTDEKSVSQALADLAQALSIYSARFLAGELEQFRDRESIWQERLLNGQRPIPYDALFQSYKANLLARTIAWTVVAILVISAMCYVLWDYMNPPYNL